MKHIIALVGDAGTGKSTQINTLPGKVLVYAFDPNCRASVKRDDIEVVEFLPKITDFDLAITTMGNKRDPKAKKPSQSAQNVAQVYPEWIADINRRYDDGSMRELDWVVIDSITSLTSAMIHNYQFVDGSLGQAEGWDEWRVAGMRTSNVVLPLSALPTTSVMFNCHLKSKDTKNHKGEVTSSETILATYGKGHAALTQNPTEIWQTLNISRGEKEERIVQTRADFRSFQALRSSVQGLKKNEDVTLDWSKPLEGQGIARLLGR